MRFHLVLRHAFRPLSFGMAAAGRALTVLAVLALITNLHSAEKLGEPENYALSSSVSIVLGEQEKGQGLRHISNQKDGLTFIEGFNGVAARALRLEGTHTALNFYFQIDPAFKQEDVSTVRIEVEYLAPQPGRMGVHYDALDNDNLPNPKYRDTGDAIPLAGSTVWTKATFRTKGDAAFSNRQNGRADFRIWAQTPLLYVRKVTVTRDSPDEKWNNHFSTTNQVTVLLGQEKPEEEGLRFVEQAGQAAIQVLDGVPCRYLNRMRENRMFGSLYFAISPSFKAEGLKNARVEVEYFAKQDIAFRLQVDGMDGERHRLYMPVLPEGARVMRFGTGADYAFSKPWAWSVAVFHVTNGVFMNSQRNAADFRLEVVPPEIHVRRVTVTRADSSDNQSPSQR